MFYDLEDPNKFVSDIKTVMDPNGLWIVQMSYLPLMLKQHDLGNICHEHLEYYSLESLEYLLKRHEFSVFDVQLNDVNGGSFRVLIRNRDADETLFGDQTYRRQATERVNALRASEAAMTLGDANNIESLLLGWNASNRTYSDSSVNRLAMAKRWRFTARLPKEMSCCSTSAWTIR